VLPALFINELLAETALLKSSNVEMHVLCMGDLVGSEHPWTDLKWTRGEVPSVVTDVLQSLYDSKAFKAVLTIVKTPLESKRIRRVCVWFRVDRHVNTLWWEITKEGSVCFMMDNINSMTKLSQHIVTNFRDTVSELTGKMVHMFSHADAAKMLYAEHIGLGGHMVCVSYMSRITLYMSMVDLPSFEMDGTKIKASNAILAAGDFSDVAGMYLEMNMFMDFLWRLTIFVETASKEKRLVLISPIDSTFANIKDVFLRTVDFSDAVDSKLRDYVYKGSGGFVDRSAKADSVGLHAPDVGCVVHTQFNLLPRIRECKRLVDALRLYKSV
jgi:hypothetical protein